MRRFAIALAACLPTLSVVAVAAGADDTFVQALARSDRALNSISFSCAVSDASESASMQAEYRRYGQWFLLRHKVKATTQNSTPRENVFGANSRYSFVVAIEGEKPRLVSLGAALTALPSNSDFIQEVTELLMGIAPCHLLHHHSPLRFTEHVAAKWTTAGQNNTGYLCAAYNAVYRPPLCPPTVTVTVAGTVQFHPVTGIIIAHKYSGGPSHLEASNYSSVEIEAETSADGSAPRQVRITGRKGDLVFREQTITYAGYSESPPKEEQAYSLSALGLEEPHGVTWPKPTPYWLYGTLGSVAVIVLGILLMRWSQRRSAAA